jgi:hypothetical protein
MIWWRIAGWTADEVQKIGNGNPDEAKYKSAGEPCNRQRVSVE